MIVTHLHIKASDRLAGRVEDMTFALHQLDELITAADHRGD
jgi:hypothetical protein